MKKIALLLTILIITGCGSTVNTGDENGGETPSDGNGHTIDQSTPEAVIEAVIHAAEEKEYASVKDLCDPDRGNDSDTDRICELTEEGHEDDQEKFVNVWADAKIEGEAVITDNKAEVTVMLGEEETVVDLINVEGKWYLFQY